MILKSIKATVVLKLSQISNVNELEKTILIDGSVMEDLEKKIIELKKGGEKLEYQYAKEKLLAKHLRTDIILLNDVVKKYRMDIKDEIMKKFKTEKNWSFIDHMEMTIINYMIIQANSNVTITKEAYTNKNKLLKVNNYLLIIFIYIL